MDVFPSFLVSRTRFFAMTLASGAYVWAFSFFFSLPPRFSATASFAEDLWTRPGTVLCRSASTGGSVRLSTGEYDESVSAFIHRSTGKQPHLSIVWRWSQTLKFFGATVFHGGGPHSHHFARTRFGATGAVPVMALISSSRFKATVLNRDDHSLILILFSLNSTFEFSRGGIDVGMIVQSLQQDR